VDEKKKEGGIILGEKKRGEEGRGEKKTEKKEGRGTVSPAFKGKKRGLLIGKGPLKKAGFFEGGGKKKTLGDRGGKGGKKKGKKVPLNYALKKKRKVIRTCSKKGGKGKGCPKNLEKN